MKHMTRSVCTLLLVGIALVGYPCLAESVKVDPGNCVIVLHLESNLSPSAVNSHRTAAEELRKHLALVTGTDISIVTNDAVAAGKYPFYFGVVPPGDTKPIVSQESRWLITEKGAWFYGDTSRQGTGAQYALYAFLEDQLGIRWTEAGDLGIAYTEQSPLILTIGVFNWIPELMFRKIRTTRKVKAIDPSLSPEQVAEKEKENKRASDLILWQARMRMGGSRPGGGHSFVTWWDKYGETHPEYFALNKFGKREPVQLANRTWKQSCEWVKICPSNPDVAAQIVADWLPRKDFQKYVNVCSDDGDNNFCECENCKKLDVLLPGEQFGDNTTDRYVYLANAVAREVRKHRPDAWVTMHAYLSSSPSPRKLKLEPNVVVIIPPYVDPMDVNLIKEWIGGWYDAGAKAISFRPNYHYKYSNGPMPMGIEKQMFDVFQVAVSLGAIAFDYDNQREQWPVTGMSDYILAHAFTDPAKPFEYWEDQYCQAYGSASEEVKAYFRYWRHEMWDKRLLPNMLEILELGGSGTFERGLMWCLDKYYNPEDFDLTDAILQKAAEKNLTGPQRDKVTQLILANQHARLIYDAVIPPPPEKYEYTLRLMAFRERYKDILRMPLAGCSIMEIGLADITGIELAKSMNGYLQPWLETDLVWRFKLDSQNVGMDQAWQAETWDQTAAWEHARTDKIWENQYNETEYLSPETREQLKRYDGVAWYATQYSIPADWKGRKIFLRFGAVDESCWIYVNGVYAGEHLFQEANDWKTPFEIRVDERIDWDNQPQRITVRVEDLSGGGGIWKRVWLVSKE